MITHGHSDHARPGHGAVLATQETLDMMRLRYGENFAGSTQAIAYGEEAQARRRQRHVPSGRPCAGLGADRGRPARIPASSPPATTRTRADPTCAPFELVPCDVFITEATFGLPVFRHGDAADEIAKLLRSVALFPERAHLVGAYSLGKAQRVIALIARPATTSRSICMARWRRSRTITRAAASTLGELRPAQRRRRRPNSPAPSRCARRRRLQDVWTRRFPDPVPAFASGWMRVRARARQRGVELPLVISDHADWDGLTATIAATGAGEIWVTHGQEDALVHWCTDARA